MRLLPLLDDAPRESPEQLAFELSYDPEDQSTFYDFCLMPYAPRASSNPRRLSSVNALLASFAQEGVLEEGTRLIDELRARIGALCTVYGVKHNRDKPGFSWEFYFYKRDHTSRDLSLDFVAPCFPCEIDGRFPPDADWQFFSVEVDAQSIRGVGLATATLYQEGENVSWKLSGGRFELANTYAVFDARSQAPEFLRLLYGSIHAPRHPLTVARLVPPQMLECWRIWLAHKRFSDTIYWQRIDTTQLLWSLRWQKWPEAFIRSVTTMAPGMAHLSWDVGADFHRLGESKIGEPPVAYSKSGIHGTF